MKISEKLRKVRIDNNKYQKDVAKLLNVQQSAVAKWEREENIPNIYDLLDLARFYNMSFDEFFEDVKR